MEASFNCITGTPEYYSIFGFHVKFLDFFTGYIFYNGCPKSHRTLYNSFISKLM